MLKNQRFTSVAVYPANFLWHLLIDSINHESPGAAWMAEEEPGYLKSMFNGLDFVLQTLDTPLSVQHLIELHAEAIKYTNRIETWEEPEKGIVSKLKPFTKCLRHGYGVEFGLMTKPEDTNCSKKGIAELLDKISGGDDYFSIENFDGSIRINTKTISSIDISREALWNEIQNNNFQISIKALSENDLIARINKIITTYHQQLAMSENENDKIHVIANCIHELELTHPFDDGNCRTMSVILLNQLLLQQGFSPAILEYRDKFDAFSIDELCNEIKLGMQKFQSQQCISHDQFFSDKIPVLYIRDIQNKRDYENIITIMVMQLTDSLLDKNPAFSKKYNRENLCTAIYSAVKSINSESLSNFQFQQIKEQLFSLIQKNIQKNQPFFYNLFGWTAIDSSELAASINELLSNIDNFCNIKSVPPMP